MRRAAYESRQLLLVGWKDEFDQGAICRRDPAPPAPRDVNSKTVYVEGLPKDATIEWLQVRSNFRKIHDFDNLKFPGNNMIHWKLESQNININFRTLFLP